MSLDNRNDGNATCRGRVEQPHEGDGLSCALAHGGLQGYVTSASNSPKDLPEGLPPALGNVKLIINS